MKLLHTNTERERKVSRVLVMIEYEPGQPSEVFDLTALVSELFPKASYQAHIDLRVTASKNYGENKPPFDLNASWSGDAGEWCPQTANLADVMNFVLPDNDRVINLRKKSKRMRKKADEIDYEAKLAKLDQVAGLRHQYPIAHVTQSDPILPLSTPGGDGGGNKV